MKKVKQTMGRRYAWMLTFVMVIAIIDNNRYRGNHR